MFHHAHTLSPFLNSNSSCSPLRRNLQTSASRRYYIRTRAVCPTVVARPPVTTVPPTSVWQPSESHNTLQSQCCAKGSIAIDRFPDSYYDCKYLYWPIVDKRGRLLAFARQKELIGLLHLGNTHRDVFEWIRYRSGQGSLRQSDLGSGRMVCFLFSDILYRLIGGSHAYQAPVEIHLA